MASLNVTQATLDAVRDPFISEGLRAFVDKMKHEHVEQLLRRVRASERDTMKEARLAGKVEAYETIMSDLEMFCEEQLKGASQ